MNLIKKTNISKRQHSSIVLRLRFTFIRSSSRIITLKTIAGQRSWVPGRAALYFQRIRIIFILVVVMTRSVSGRIHGNAQETNPPGISRRGNISFCTLLFAKRSVSIPRAWNVDVQRGRMQRVRFFSFYASASIQTVDDGRSFDYRWFRGVTRN